ncbi:hypothetical protein PPUTLS46_015879 [Pseudomonas putida LS46]|nr:hypothetical protein PPUTLS46_015879 [Pseudomonas putida LS46]
MIEISLMKSLPVAIGLNFLFPGAGYIYYGKLFVGLLVFALGFVCFKYGVEDTVVWFWLGLNLIMFVDISMLHKRSAES